MSRTVIDRVGTAPRVANDDLYGASEAPSELGPGPLPEAVDVWERSDHDATMISPHTAMRMMPTSTVMKVNLNRLEPIVLHGGQLPAATYKPHNLKHP